MTIGEKIRQARLDMGLSQRQLCGEKITRNMLSQIENGSARPSMDTLSWFAHRLGRPVSYFLDEKAVTSPNQALIAAARIAFCAENYTAALDALKGYRAPDPVFDPEKELLENLCRLFLAQTALAENRVPYAHQLLDSIVHSPYFSAPLVREKQLLQGCLPVADDRELLLRAENALAKGDAPRALEYLNAAEDREHPHWNLLCGKANFTQKAYAQAIPCFKKAETAYPEQAATALEICHRELGDFQNAYLYACKLRNL